MEYHAIAPGCNIHVLGGHLSRYVYRKKFTHST